MSHTRLASLAVILPELLTLDHFRFNFVSAPLLEYSLEYNHDTSLLCRTAHDDVLHTRMTTLAFILSELLALNGFRCNFLSVP